MQARMVYLPDSLAAWDKAEFQQVLKQELESLGIDDLPLQAGLSASSYVVDKPFTVMVMNSEAQAEKLVIKLAVLYTGTVAGCNCADDPSPVDEVNEYCEMLLEMDSHTGSCQFSLLD